LFEITQTYLIFYYPFFILATRLSFYRVYLANVDANALLMDSTKN